MVRHLRSKQSNLEITDEDVLCVELAALVHDLGQYAVHLKVLFIFVCVCGSDSYHQACSHGWEFGGSASQIFCATPNCVLRIKLCFDQKSCPP